MAKDDKGWDNFREELGYWMARRDFSVRRLQEELNATGSFDQNFSEGTVAKWKTTTMPPLGAIPEIGRILQIGSDRNKEEFDPLHLPRVMGLLPELPEVSQLVAAALRVERLRTKLEEQSLAVAASGRSSATGRVVRAALATREWATAAWPAIEGPDAYEVHVSDRIDFRYVGRASAPDGGVWASLPMRTALRDANAVLSRRTPRWSEDPVYEHWSIDRLAAPMGAVVNFAHPRLRAITVTSLTEQAWPIDVAAVLALVLGYGYSSVRDLARDVWDASPEPPAQIRADFHESLLYQRIPSRRVWAHYGTPRVGDHFPFADATGHTHNELLHVRLEEDDDLLEDAAKIARQNDEQTEVSFESLEAERRRSRTARDGVPHAQVVTCHHHVTDSVSARWEQTLHSVRAVLRYLERNEHKFNLRGVHERVLETDPATGGVALRWLADHETPYVDLDGLA